MLAVLLALALPPAVPVLEPSWPMAVAGVGPDRSDRSEGSPVPRDRPPRTRDVIVPEQGWPAAQPQAGVVTPIIEFPTIVVDPAVFAAIAPLDCPAGTAMVERLPQNGGNWFEQWCARPDGVRHGPIATWHDNAEIWQRGQYVDGQFAGTWTSWHPTGEKQGEHQYVDGKLHGVARVWHRNGQLEEESHRVAGERHGATTRWYANGQVFVTTDYVHDAIADGIHRFYYEKGGVLEEGRYRGGKQHGVWTVYHPDGHVLGRKRWVRGVQR